METITKKKKILFVITKSNFGGAQKYVYDLATGLPQSEFEVAVALGGEGALARKLREARVRTISLSSLMRDVSPLKDMASFVALFKLFRSERPDVVHLNSAKASGLGALAARLAGVPKIIFTAHGWAFNEDRSFISRIIIKLFSWVTVLLAHKTIAVSEAVRHDTQNWLFVQDKVVTVHNRINDMQLLSREESRTHLAEKNGVSLPKDATLVGTIAELHKNKGLTYAIEAFALLAQKNTSLFYFILGEGEERAPLEALIKQRGLQNHVFLLGFVEDAPTYLKAFDIFLLPSIKEGLPYVILEAGLAELPIIATEIGGIPEIIEYERTGLLVPARDPDAIGSAIEKLASDPARAKHLGTALRERVLADFSLKRTLADTTVLYMKN